MNVSNRIKTDPAFKDRYVVKMTALQSHIKSFADMQAKNAEAAKKAAKKESKKQRTRDALVTGSTKPTEIKKYITALNQKISEIANGDDNLRVKQMRMQLLQNKIAGMQKILDQQVKKEQERHIAKTKKKKITDKVYLTKDDLTLEGKEDKNDAVAFGETSNASGFDAISSATDALTSSSGDAQFEAEA